MILKISQSKGYMIFVRVSIAKCRKLELNWVLPGLEIIQ